MFLYNACGLHRFRRDIAHNHPFLQLPHHYECIAREFYDVPVMRENLLHHRTDIAVQSFRQFGRTANTGLRVFFREVCETCTVIKITRYITCDSLS